MQNLLHPTCYDGFLFNFSFSQYCSFLNHLPNLQQPNRWFVYIFTLIFNKSLLIFFNPCLLIFFILWKQFKIFMNVDDAWLCVHSLQCQKFHVNSFKFIRLIGCLIFFNEENYRRFRLVRKEKSFLEDFYLVKKTLRKR